jgi:hypothetical protein
MKHSPVATALGIIAPDHAHVYCEQYWYENLPVLFAFCARKLDLGREALLGYWAFGRLGSHIQDLSREHHW